ncbi:helix-turn-helix domain-containing protein [Vagococcus lutrae]|uniref:helix-turn-helix domain-containing protein n=1 Tax=Vagococcus lutrae TaxID=81947 RepID=UPI002010382C|nr:helix-turn-helix domain-containing protein [Vagococcus lutrae]UQF11568.1 helix-turn-helix domain-containing protein [Vagococcus lutrae]
MLFLLDSDKKRKLDILNAIYKAPYHRISFHTLQQDMKLSTVTLTTALSQLIDDIELICTESIILEYRQGNQKWYELPEKQHFIQTQLSQYYMQNSIKFHLIKDLFLNDGGTLNEFSQTYFLSPSKITREIKKLNSMLVKHHLQIEGFKQLKLKGTESSIRYFFVHLFFHTYQGLDWPFTNMNPLLMNYYQELIPKKLYRLLDVKVNLFASYIVAVSLTRCAQTHYLEKKMDSDWLYEEALVTDYEEKTENFILYLLNDPQYSAPRDVLAKEVRFIYSFVFSQQNFIDDYTDIPTFFFNSTLTSLHYMQNIDNILEQLASLFDYDLDGQTRSIWRYHLTVIHYRLLLFPEILVTLPAYWTVDFLTIIEKDLYYQLTYERIRGNLTIFHEKINQRHLDYLARAYSVLAMPYVSSYFMKHTINVLFLTNHTDFHFLYKALTSDFARVYLRIEAVEMRNPNTDVIISDTLVNPTLLGLPADTPIIYYETNAYFDYLNHIQKQLFQIQLQKNGLNA